MPGTGTVAPESDEAPTDSSGRGFKDQGTADARIVAAVAAERERIAAHDKALATLRARAALAGLELQIIDRGDGQSEFLLSKWNLVKVLPDLDAVERWLTGFGAPA